MMISENALEQALAQIFDGKSAGEKLSLAEISTVWNASGLHSANMRDAIREMIECHCLETQSHHGGLEFVLTRHGEQRFNSCRPHAVGSQNPFERGLALQH
ncbi:hypothetical protein [Stenotrophobium rhamnosiphilum]|uniref:Uncharacterized protein n=1 Tax=Stenotrophobium rhamnosiphilum TaxID=2029166 RepID=A0A2T5MFV5_9GAMM|nr:hypothetical protein [Stenotrophobium rhamnosiphilum]PTU31450.1 hypothetical protein CJD38_08910 [Stenotrophobium rhamnosiphilum]